MITNMEGETMNYELGKIYLDDAFGPSSGRVEIELPLDGPDPADWSVCVVMSFQTQIKRCCDGDYAAIDLAPTVTEYISADDGEAHQINPEYRGIVNHYISAFRDKIEDIISESALEVFHREFGALDNHRAWTRMLDDAWAANRAQIRYAV
jgi:hypothetical protein